MDYDDRELFSVTLGPLDLQQTENGPMVGTDLYINVSSRDGTAMGPGIRVSFGFPASPSSTLEQSRAQALDAAHALVQRIARMSIEELRAAYDKSPLFAAHQE